MPEATTTTETVETTPETVTTETVTTEVAETPDTKAERLAKELSGAQAQIGKLNKENEKRRLDEKQAAEKKLVDDGKLQELADTRASERDAVTAERDVQAAKLNRLNEILGGDVDKRIEKWPDEVKKLIPSGEGVDALARFERVSELAPLAERLMNVTARPGNGAGPTPSGGPASNTVDGPRPQNYRI